MANPIADEAALARTRADELDAQAEVLDLFTEYLSCFTEVVVLVTRKYPGQTQAYEYALVRFNAGTKKNPVHWWATSGDTRTGPMDDAGFVKFITSEETVSAWIATDFERIDAL